MTKLVNMIILLLIFIVIIVGIILYFYKNKEKYLTFNKPGLELIIYINLDKRKDRRKDVEKFINKINNQNIPVYRLSATFNKRNGHLGCADSHIRALKYAKQQKVNNVLILEDDVSLNCTPTEFNNKIIHFFNNYHNYDAVTLFGYHKGGIISLDKHISKFSPTDGYSTTALGYIVNKKAYDDFLRVFSKAKQNMIKELKTYEGRSLTSLYAIDIAWGELQKKKKFYIFEPHIVKPSGSPSEIMKEYYSGYSFRL